MVEILAEAPSGGHFERVTTAPSAAEAFRRLKDFTPDVAILDVNLGSGTSLPVAEELVRRLLAGELAIEPSAAIQGLVQPLLR